MSGRFDKFNLKEQYYYSFVSSPNQSLNRKLETFWKLFKDNDYRRKYIADCKNFKYKDKCPELQRIKMKKYYRLYKLSDLIIVAFISNSFYRHYTNKYFSTNSRLLDIYIVSKLSFYILFYFGVKFFVMKNYSDSILYDYYSKVEYENAVYSSNLLKSSKDLDEMKNSIKSTSSETLDKDKDKRFTKKQKHTS